jgi:hypothetical protein
MSIGTKIISDEVPINENGFHWRAHGRHGTIYYVENGKLLTIKAEVPSEKNNYDILVLGKADNLKFWEFPEKQTISAKKAQEIEQKLLKWLHARNWKHELADEL